MYFAVLTEDNVLVQVFMHKDLALRFADQMTRPGRAMHVEQKSSGYPNASYRIE